jgi:O-antigen/teichoic acid export membrane protein
MIKRNLFYNSLLSITQFIFPLITFPYSSRILGPGGIGSVNFIDSFTQYFILFSALGIPLYGVREVAKYRNQPSELSRVFSEILLIHLVSTCIFSVIYITCALTIPTLKAHLSIVWVGIIMLFSNFFLIEWFFQGIENFKYITTRALIVRVLSVIFLFVFLKPGADPVVYYAISASGLVITSILNMFFLRRHLTFKFRHFNFKEHLKPLSIILGSTLAVSVYLLMDNIILGFIKNENAVGIYSTAVRIVKIPFAVIVAISTVIIPQVSMAYSENDIEKVKLLIHKSFSFICLFGIPIAAGIYISSSFLVHNFAGNKFSGSIVPVRILSPVIILVGLNNIFGFQILTPIGKEKFLLRAVVIGMFVSLTLNLCLIPLFSYIGAAVTNLLTEAIVTLFCYIFVRKYITIKFDLTIFLQCTLGAAFFFIIAFLIRGTSISFNFREIIIIISCIIFYSVYTWFFINNIYVLNFKQMIISRILT